MKRITFPLLFLIGFTSCQKDESVNPSDDSAENEVVLNTDSLNETLINADGLRISEFREDGIDKTTLFDAYLFTFNSDGGVLASKAGESINGTYVVFRDDEKTELSMTFPNDSELYELTDDWYFISYDQEFIRFEDSGDVIEFQK